MGKWMQMVDFISFCTSDGLGCLGLLIYPALPYFEVLGLLGFVLEIRFSGFLNGGRVDYDDAVVDDDNRFKLKNGREPAFYYTNTCSGCHGEMFGFESRDDFRLEERCRRTRQRDKEASIEKNEAQVLNRPVADMHYGTGLTRCRDVLSSEFEWCSDLNTTLFLKRMIHVEKPDFIAFTGMLILFIFISLDSIVVVFCSCASWAYLYWEKPITSCFTAYELINLSLWLSHKLKLMSS
ncbi:Metallophosphoesterase domain-containing protein [Artemisia annua]|uniref:Metallophosphoesterase domain-containing protein n=1 Tax=Artemisia annua TaxID=35608 RepID=A0A2U1NT08_ARTAN|nr:Metallophosphoesterase domain-containing protein [Artemisia annua]